MGKEKLPKPGTIPWDKIKEVRVSSDGKAYSFEFDLSWNWLNKKPLKSYVIQRLVEDIFKDREIDGWKGAVRAFFKEAINLFEEHLNDEIILKDRVYTQKSILNDYDQKQVNKFECFLRNGNNLAKKNQWEKLFGK